MLDFIGKMFGICHLHDINEILTHPFQISVDDFLAMEIFNAMCDIKSLNKATIMNAIPNFVESYQKNTIGGICVRSLTIPTIQKFYYAPVFHPRRHKAKFGVQGVFQKVDAVEG
jgi:hypothetical protein